MKQAKLIELDDATMLTLSIEALTKKMRLKPYIEQMLKEQAQVIDRRNEWLQNELKNDNKEKNK